MNPTATNSRDRVAEVVDHKRISHGWMQDSFYAQWTTAYRAYLCEREPEKDPNNPNRADLSRTAIGAPDTWSTVNREVARVTAQAPNLHFRCDDKALGELIGLKLMRDWDLGGVQRIQKRHVRQVSIFGWSVRAWFWDRQILWRSKRVDAIHEQAPLGLAAIADYYAGQIAALAPGADPMQAVQDPQVRAILTARLGRGGLLPIRYRYVAYEGPRAEFLFAGDCFPEPGFQSIQTSRWFIVERRRNRDWLMGMAQAVPELAAGIEDLLNRYPNGSPKRTYSSGSSTSLRHELLSVSGVSTTHQATDERTDEWTILEEHRPGLNPTVTLVGEDSVLIGEIAYPYDLDGKIAFTECVLTDNLLHGVGDSAPRILRGVQELRSILSCRLADAYDYGLRPLLGTTDKSIYDNPQEIRPGPGYRLVYLKQGPGSVWVQDSSGVLAAAAAAHTHMGNLARDLQMGSGDSNMSMMAGVDPQQGRTATGARIVQANLDTLTRDKIDMFTQSSLVADAEMMFLLNRSELSDPVQVEAGRYARGPLENRSVREEWARVEPLMFQREGQMIVEAGSTVADDDDARLERATGMFQMLSGNPHVDQRRLVIDLLTAHGKGNRLADYLTKEQPGPPPEPPAKASVSVSAKLEALPPEAQQMILSGVGLLPAGPPAGGSPPGTGPGGAPAGEPPQGPPQGPVESPEAMAGGMA